MAGLRASPEGLGARIRYGKPRAKTGMHTGEAGARNTPWGGRWRVEAEALRSTTEVARFRPWPANGGTPQMAVRQVQSGDGFIGCRVPAV
jgi:hypothetical protein